MRIGQGFDVHELVEGRPCIIGGVHIPHEKGLQGVTDADVLCHSLIDSLLGALGLGDIGTMFPANDKATQGAESSVLLKKTCQRVKEEGYVIGNIDATILAEAPQLSPYVPKMRAVLATCCDISLDQVSVKATTMEKMGFIGRKEAIGAMSVVLLKRI